MVSALMARRISDWTHLVFKATPFTGSAPPLLVSLLVWLALSACSTPSLQNGVFRNGDVAFRVGPVPTHWTPIEEEQTDAELATFAFRNANDQATVGVAARCHRDGDDVPLRSLTQHLYLGFTDRETRSEDEFMLDGRAALRTEMVASLDGVPKEMTFVVVKKDGCVYDFWRVAANAAPDPEFDAFVNGFQVLTP